MAVVRREYNRWIERVAVEGDSDRVTEAARVGAQEVVRGDRTRAEARAVRISFEVRDVSCADTRTVGKSIPSSRHPIATVV